MKAWVLPVAALCAGLVGGTAASWALKRNAAPAAPALSETAVARADSVHDEPAPSPPAAAEAASAPESRIELPVKIAEAAMSAMAHSPDSAAAHANTSMLAQPVSPPASESTVAVDSTTVNAADTSAAVSDTATQRLARIFGAMRPEDAARLLEPLDDVRLRSILLALSDRKAAAILAKFKGERSATLARALTNGGED